MGAPYPTSGAIPGAVKVWRRIPQKPSHCIFDENDQAWVPTSAAFKDHPDGSSMSVAFDVGQSSSEILAGHEGMAVVSLIVNDLRSLGLEVVPAPLEDDENHAEVIGHKTKSICRAMAKMAVWVVAPTANPRENVG